MTHLTIEIFRSENDGHIHYNIYDTDDIEDVPNCDPIDGGICTGSWNSAIESASDMAKDVLRLTKGDVKPEDIASELHKMDWEAINSYCEQEDICFVDILKAMERKDQEKYSRLEHQLRNWCEFCEIEGGENLPCPKT